MDLDLLKESIPFRWRVQNFSKSSATAVCVAYIDARDVMDMLDATVGTENWQSDYKEIKGNLYGGIGIKIKDEWIWKWDCGTESYSDKIKGEASDAFKRAAVKWGVGRFLYDIPVQYCKTNEPKKDNNYPYVIDEEGNKVKNLSDYINQREKVLIFQNRSKALNQNKAPLPLQPTETETVAKVKIEEEEIPEITDEQVKELTETSKLGKLVTETLATAQDEKSLLARTKELIETYGIDKKDSFLKNKFNYNKFRIQDTQDFFNEQLPKLKVFSDLTIEISTLFLNYPEIRNYNNFFIDIINKCSFTSKVDLEALKIFVKGHNQSVIKTSEFIEAIKAKRID